jgi:hypothetical protein
MSTRSLIGFVQPSGRVVATYCHYDGYPDGVGAMLDTNYNDAKSAKAVASVGYLSSLEADLALSIKIAANKQKPYRLASAEDFVKKGTEMWTEWGYLWQDGKWFGVKFGGGAGPFLVSAADPEGKLPANFKPIPEMV